MSIINLPGFIVANLQNPVLLRNLTIDKTNTYIYAAGSRFLSTETDTSNSWYTGSYVYIDRSNTYVYSMTNTTLYRYPVTTTNAPVATILATNLHFPRHMCIDSTGTYLYIVNTGGAGNAGIMKYSTSEMNQTGSIIANSTNSVPCANIMDMCIDSTDTYVYCTNNTRNTVAKYSTSGGNAPGILIADSSNTGVPCSSPIGICIDSTDTYVYVCNGSYSVTSGGTVGKYSTTGGNLPGSIVTDDNSVPYPNYICIDSTNTYVYVTGRTSHRILKYFTIGGNRPGIIVASESGNAVINSRKPQQICIDSTDTYIYVILHMNIVSNVGHHINNDLKIVRYNTSFPPPITPSFVSPYTTTSSAFPYYIRSISGSIGISGEAGNTFSVIGSIPNTYSISGVLHSSGKGMLSYYGLSSDGPYNFSVVTTNSVGASSASATVYLYVKTSMPSYPTITIRDGSTYSLSSATIPMYTNETNSSITLSGDTNVYYTIWHSSGGTTVYDLSSYNASGGNISIGYNLSASYVPVTYTVQITDYATNVASTMFSLYVLPTLTIPPSSYYVSTVAGERLITGYTDGSGYSIVGNSSASNVALIQGFSYNDIICDIYGNIYFVNRYAIRKITKQGGIYVVSTIAGISTRGFRDGSGWFIDGDSSANNVALFYNPTSIAIDSCGNIYVADNSCVRKITPDIGSGTYIVTTIAGIYNSFTFFDGSGWTISGSTTINTGIARFSNVRGVAIDASNTIYVSDKGNNRIRRITLSNNTYVVSTLAGTSATFNSPEDLTIDVSGNLFVIDYNNGRIRKITPQGSVSTVIGSSRPVIGYTDGPGWSITGNSPTTNVARVWDPAGISVDMYGNIYFNDRTGSSNSIRKITPNISENMYVVSTIAGRYTDDLKSTDGMGWDIYGSNTNNISSFYTSVTSVCADIYGNIYVKQNEIIRNITLISPPPPTPTFVSNPIYTNASGGAIYISGEVGDALYVSSTLPNMYYTFSGVLTSSGAITYFNLPADASYSFSVYTTNITSGTSSNIATVSLILKTSMPSYPTITISGGSTYSLSSATIPIYTNLTKSTWTLSGDPNVYYTVYYLSGSSTVYNLSGYNSVDGTASRSYSLPTSYFPITYTASIQDYANNITTTTFLLYVLSSQPMPLLSISGSTHSVSTTNISGGTIYTNSSSGFVKLTVSGSYPILYDVSFSNQDPSGILYGSAIFPYTNMTGKNIGIVSLSDFASPVPNVAQYPFSLIVLTAAPVLTSLSISGSTNPNATIYAGGQTLYTNVSNATLLLTISGALSNVFVDLSYSNKNLSGTMVSPYPSFPFAVSTLSGIVPCLLTLKDVVNNVQTYSFSIRYSSTLPTYPSFTISGSASSVYSTSGSLLSRFPVYTNISNGIITLSGDTNMFYSISGGTNLSGSDTNGRFVVPYTLQDGSYNYTIQMTNTLYSLSRSAYFTLVVDTQPPISTSMSISGGVSFNPIYTFLSLSGGTLYTNVSNGIVRVSISGEAIPVFYTSSLKGFMDSSGTLFSSKGGGIPYTNLTPDGSYNYFITFTDAAGNISHTSYTIVVDTVAPGQPLFSILGGTGQSSTSSNPGTIYTSVSGGTVLIGLSNEFGTQYDVSLHNQAPNTIRLMDASGGSFTYTFTTYSTNTYTITETDKAGNTKPYTLNIVYISPIFPNPTLSLNGSSYGPTSGIYYTYVSNGSFTLSGTANMLVNVVPGLSDTSFGSSPYRTVSYTLPNGSYPYSITLTNQTATTQSYSYTLVVDTVAPAVPTYSIPIVFGTSSGSTVYTNVSGGTLQLFVSGETGTLFSISGYPSLSGTLVNGLGSFAYSNLSIGSNALFVVFKDLAQNSSTYPLTLRHSTTLPSYPSFSLSGSPSYSTSGSTVVYTNVSSGSITLSGDIQTFYTISYTGSSFSLSGTDTNGRFVVPYSLIDASYIFTVGMTNTLYQTNRTVYFTVVVDRVAPSAPSFNVGNAQYASLSGSYTKIGISGCTFTISGEAHTTYLLSHTLSGSTYQDTSSTLVGGFISFLGSSLPNQNQYPDGFYTFFVSLVDKAGNMSKPSSCGFTVITTLPSKPGFNITNSQFTQTLSGAYTNVGISGCTFTISGDGSNNFVINSSINGTALNPLYGDLRLSNTIVLSGTNFSSISGDGVYIFSLNLVDQAGNQSVSTAISFVVDTQAPSIPSFNMVNSQYPTTLQGAYTKIGISGSTFLLSGEVGTTYYISHTYNGSSSYPDISGKVVAGTNTIQGSLLTSHVVADGSYVFCLQLRDIATNISPAAYVSFTLDRVPPSEPIYSMSGGTTFGSTMYTSTSGGYVSVRCIGETGTSYSIGGTVGTFSGDTILYKYSNLVFGTNTFSIILTDRANNTNTYSFVLSYSNSPPSLPFLLVSRLAEVACIGNPILYTNVSGGTIRIRGDSSILYTVSHNGVPDAVNIPDTSGSITFPYLSTQGSQALFYSIHMVNVNLSTLFTDTSFTLYVDTVAPSRPIITQAPTTVTTSSCSFTMSGELNTSYCIYIDGTTGYTPFLEPSAGYAMFQSVATIPYILLRGTMVSSSQTIQLAGLGDGPHTIQVYLRDIAGNASAVTSFMITNTIPPPTPPIAQSGNTLTFPINPSVTYNVYVGGVRTVLGANTYSFALPTTSITYVYITSQTLLSQTESAPSSTFLHAPITPYSFPGPMVNSIFSTTSLTGSFTIYGCSGLSYSLTRQIISQRFRMYTDTIVNAGVFASDSLPITYTLPGYGTYIYTLTYSYIQALGSYSFTIHAYLPISTTTLTVSASVIHICQNGTTCLSIQSDPQVYYTFSLTKYDTSGQLDSVGAATVTCRNMNPGRYTATVIVSDIYGSSSLPIEVSWIVPPRTIHPHQYDSESIRIELRKYNVMKRTNVIYPKNL